jgi:hypothetical protein
MHGVEVRHIADVVRSTSFHVGFRCGGILFVSTILSAFVNSFLSRLTVALTILVMLFAS